MSGPRITRKVTVEVGKKVTENVPSSVVQQSASSSSSSSTRRSVFDRLGPGAVERPKARDTYTPDKCRNWLRDGRCPYGSNCKFLHGPYTDPKPRTKSVRSIVHSGSKDRYDDSDEKQQMYHSRSFDSADFDDEDIKETPKLKRRHKSEEDLSDTSIKKSTKIKKKRKEDVDEDDEAKIKRKRKAHRKREASPKLQARASNEDEEDYDRAKNERDWEEHGDLDFERQLELERRRQDLQRQLALMDEEDAAASTGETEWKGKEKEEDHRKVPIIHSKLHPQPSPSTPDGDTPTQVVKKKKKKKLDSEGKKIKVKKEASPRKKEEIKHNTSETVEDDNMVKKDETVGKKKKAVTEYAVSSDEGDGHPTVGRNSRKVSRHADEAQLNEPHDSPPIQRPDERKRPEDAQIRHKREEAKPTKDRRKIELSSDDQRLVDEARPRRPRETSQDYYPSTDEQDEGGRKVRVRATGARRPNEPKRIDEGITEDRGRRREGDSRGPRTPSPPANAKDDRYYYDEQQDDAKKKRVPRGPPRSPPREPTRDESVHRKEQRGRADDPHIRGPRTPSDDEGHFTPPPGQVDNSRSSRYGERERGPPRREARVPLGDQGEQRYPDRGGRGNMDTDYERRKPREDDMRGRRPPDYPQNRDDEYPKHRGRDDNYPRENREEEFPRHRGEREEIKDDRDKYRDERPDDFPVRSRARDEPDFPRSRGRDERDDEVRGRPPQRDVHRRMHDDPEERDRPRADYDSRGRYGPSPTQPPPRGRSPLHRYEDRRRPDETFRSGPGGRDAPGRGRAVGRGRSAYTSPYDSRGKMVDTRRRSPPPPGPRSSYQDRDRGPPRGRDVPIGRGRGFMEKGRPPNDRYRDPSAPWDRRGERDYPPRDPAVRDRRARESPPPHPTYRDERPWEENERREAPQRPGNFPAPERRGQYDTNHDGKARMVSRERHSLERGAPEWEYEDDANQAKPIRKRPRPVAGRSESPFEAKKVRGQSPISPDEGPDVDDVAATVAEQPDRPKKAAVGTKEIKKIKKKKKEGKVAKVAAVEGQVEGTATDETKPIKGEKKIKKEKKLKEKGAKKKKKIAVTAAAAAAQAVPPLEEVAGDVQPVGDIEQTPTDNDVQPKIVKKRKQVTATDNDALKEPDKPKKKKKKKHQPEVLVQPWNDLEGEEDQQEEAPKADEKPVPEIPPEKTQDDVFSDWSDDDSPVGDDSWLDQDNQDSQQSTIENKDEPIKDSPVSDHKGPSFDDVYDPISDDEFDAMYTHSDDEEITKDDKETTKALGVEDVDWSSLGISHDVNKEKEPVSHLERFKPSYVFSRIGISPALAGQRLTQLVLDACAKASDSESKKGEQLCIPEEGPKSIGAFVAAAAAKKREREGLLGNLGPCRRALCARRDLAIRKQLGRSSKYGKLSLFAASPTTPGDNELFQMSVALYKKESANNDGVRIIPSKVGSILLSQA